MLWSGNDLWIPRPDDLDWLGLRRLVLRSDQEPATLALKQAVRESMPTVEFVMEESPVEEHQSNGTIEVTVREIQKTSESDEECVGRAHENAKYLRDIPFWHFSWNTRGN